MTEKKPTNVPGIAALIADAKASNPGRPLHELTHSALTWFDLDALLAEIARLQADEARLDWLQMQYVEVREPLVHGSRACFRAVTDDSYEGEERPSDLRAKIDAACALSRHSPDASSAETG